MIKNIIKAVLLFSIASSAFAGGLEVGVKGGVSFAGFHGAEVTKLRTTYCAGGFITKKINDVLAIQSEILYTNVGTTWSTVFEQEMKTTETINYLKIPILVKITEPTSGILKPNILIGPYFAYNITANKRTEIDGQLEEEVDIGEDTKDFDFGAIIGGGIDFAFSFGTIVLDGRYMLGLTTIDEQGYDRKKRAISFMLGYGLRL